MPSEKPISMKRDPSDYAPSAVKSPEAYSAPEYPYGLCLHLDDETMKKLAMSKLPQVGKQVVVYAYANVTSVSERETLIGGSSQSVELQITDLAVSPKSDDKEAGETLYGKS